MRGLNIAPLPSCLTHAVLTRLWELGAGSCCSVAILWKVVYCTTDHQH
ncbi:hypothetical protein L916_13329 [Phytophthora nicotianae]|uniref:Uncharacterized protein n=1 Tax=Phytophthora nicotianae TaxID=4792 RepID=W2IM29_PHYNI|nr:hypothetical protein L916_13329 [Phytophthora nicotianae]